MRVCDIMRKCGEMRGKAVSIPPPLCASLSIAISDLFRAWGAEKKRVHILSGRCTCPSLCSDRVRLRMIGAKCARYVGVRYFICQPSPDGWKSEPMSELKAYQWNSDKTLEPTGTLPLPHSTQPFSVDWAAPGIVGTVGTGRAAMAEKNGDCRTRVDLRPPSQKSGDQVELSNPIFIERNYGLKNLIVMHDQTIQFEDNA